MKLSETALVLAKAQAFDNRTVGEANIAAWHEVLADTELEDALAAVTAHHASSTEYLNVGHIAEIVRKSRTVRRERIQAAGPPDFPSGLTHRQEAEYRREYHRAIGSGMNRDAATQAADRRFQIRRPELVSRPANVPNVLPAP